MKIVRLENNIVREIIPGYALPVERWYGAAFAAKCTEAPDEVEQRWVYDPATQTFSAPVEVNAEAAPLSLADLKTQLETIQAQIAKLESGA